MKTEAGLSRADSPKVPPASTQADRTVKESFHRRFWRASKIIQDNIHTDAKGYGYKYCTLQMLFKVSKPVLNNERIAYFQIIKGNQIITDIFDLENGEKMMQSHINLPEIPNPVKVTKSQKNEKETVEKTEYEGPSQEMGSQITYLRRYSLFCILGIQPEEDKDGKR